ncbi:MAG: hypothetical protein NTY09_01255 [bacterium]|nr:hypothetical protein [bacterium]
MPASADDSETIERARGTLRSLGSTELAYRGIHSTPEGSPYGSFDDLKADLFIAEGYGYSNMVENYQIRLFLNEDRTGFTVLAMPDDDSLPFFLVDESQIMYELTPHDMPDAFVASESMLDEMRTDSSPQLDEPEEISLGFSKTLYGGRESLTSVYIWSLGTACSCEPITEETE